MAAVKQLVIAAIIEEHNTDGVVRNCLNGEFVGLAAVLQHELVHLHQAEPKPVGHAARQLLPASHVGLVPLAVITVIGPPAASLPVVHYLVRLNYY